MKKIITALFVLFLAVNTSNAACTQNSCQKCSYRTQKKMLHNRKMVKNKVINAQVKGKMLAIQQLSKDDCANDPCTKQKILSYQKQIEDLTNQKICLKREYRASLRQLRASR